MRELDSAEEEPAQRKGDGPAQSQENKQAQREEDGPA